MWFSEGTWVTYINIQRHTVVSQSVLTRYGLCQMRGFIWYSALYCIVLFRVEVDSFVIIQWTCCEKTTEISVASCYNNMWRMLCMLIGSCSAGLEWQLVSNKGKQKAESTLQCCVSVIYKLKAKPIKNDIFSSDNSSAPVSLSNEGLFSL